MEKQDYFVKSITSFKKGDTITVHYPEGHTKRMKRLKMIRTLKRIIKRSFIGAAIVIVLGYIALNIANARAHSPVGCDKESILLEIAQEMTYAIECHTWKPTCGAPERKPVR